MALLEICGKLFVFVCPLLFHFFLLKVIVSTKKKKKKKVELFECLESWIRSLRTFRSLLCFLFLFKLQNLKLFCNYSIGTAAPFCLIGSLFFRGAIFLWACFFFFMSLYSFILFSQFKWLSYKKKKGFSHFPNLLLFLLDMCIIFEGQCFPLNASILSL